MIPRIEVSHFGDSNLPIHGWVNYTFLDFLLVLDVNGIFHPYK